MSNSIKYYREKAGITQQKLADILNVDRSAISKWECGDCFPRAKLLPVLAKFFNCKVDDLLKPISESNIV